MASTSMASPPSPVLHRDIRSASKSFKRDKDHSAKWIHGACPLNGAREMEDSPENENVKWIGGSPAHHVKVRPVKPFTSAEYKTHANRAPKPTHGDNRSLGWATNRVSRKIQAQVEAASTADISRSLMELIPHHVPNTSSGVQTAIYVPDDEGALSSDYSRATPVKKGRVTGLGGLVEKAEEKFLDKQTERMVQQDYEVLDVEGESIVFKAEKKRKGSPKQKTTQTDSRLEEDGFELI